MNIGDIISNICYVGLLLTIYELGKASEKIEQERRRKDHNGHNKHNSGHIFIRIQRSDVSSDLEELHKGTSGAEADHE